MKDVTKSLFFTVLKLQKIEVLKLQKIEFMKRFYKQLFYSFKTAKKLLMGTAISYFIILLPLPLPLFEKAHFFSWKKKLARSEKEMLFLSCFQNPFLCSFDTPKKRGFKTATMPAFWNSRLQPQKDVVVCINGFFDVLKLLHTRSLDTSFPYFGR